MKKPTKAERAAITAARSEARAETHAALMRWGAKPKDPDSLDYDYTLDTPHGVLRVSIDKDTILGKPKDHITSALWIFTRWDDVERAKAANLMGDLNPFSGKWNFMSHVAFLVSMQRCVFRARASRVADAVYSGWRKLFDEIKPPVFSPKPFDPGFGDNAAIRECANNSVVQGEHEGDVEVHARATIETRIKMGRWPALTEEQIKRFVAAAHEAERNEPR